MSTLTLSVRERGLLLPVMDQLSGGRIEMIVAKSIYNKVDFTLDEIALFKLYSTATGDIIGDPKTYTDLIIDLTDEQVKVLKNIPAKLEREKKVTIQYLPLLDKIDLL
jgi:hypothetical protein